MRYGISESNTAFIDGQNLYLGTTFDKWKVDLVKLRIYLKNIIPNYEEIKKVM